MGGQAAGEEGLGVAVPALTASTEPAVQAALRLLRSFGP
jgi:hypothetical protein